MVFGRIIQLHAKYCEKEELFPDTGECHAASGYRSGRDRNSMLRFYHIELRHSPELKYCPTFHTGHDLWLL